MLDIMLGLLNHVTRRQKHCQ